MKNTSSDTEYEILVYLTSKSVDDNQFFVFFALYTLLTLAAGKIEITGIIWTFWGSKGL